MRSYMPYISPAVASSISSTISPVAPSSHSHYHSQFASGDDASIADNLEFRLEEKLDEKSEEKLEEKFDDRYLDVPSTQDGLDGRDRLDGQYGNVPTSTESSLIDSIQARVEKMAAYFGRRCNVDEDDLRQEAWVAVLEMLPRLDYSVGAPEQHLLKRARWRILDSIRRQYRRPHIGLDDVPPTMTSYLDTRSGIDMGVLFARLTVTQQRILRALMEGYTWREVGSIVGCTSANVAYHVRRIRAVYSELYGADEA